MMKPITIVITLFIFSIHLFAQNQKLYGVCNGTISGSPNGLGNIFEFDPQTNLVKVIHEFNGADGSTIASGLTYLSNGFFYGATRAGGTNNKGTIFRLHPDGSDFSVLYNFHGTDGEDPLGGLAMFSDGYLYGTTIRGGSSDLGVVFRINPNGSEYSIVLNLNENSGHSPRSQPLVESDYMLLVNLSGGASNGGNILKIYPGGSFQKVVEFDGANMGASPNAGLSQGSSGKVYGTTSTGGNFNKGIIFQVNPDGTGFKKLYDFNGPLGSQPLAKLVESSSGELFGTTFDGGEAFVPGQGTYYYGVLFKIKPDGTNYTKLHDFSGVNDGSFPDGGLFEMNGKLYGITLLGGKDNLGTIYSINPDGTDYTKLYDFNPITQGQPRVNLVPAQELVKLCSQTIRENKLACDKSSLQLSTEINTQNHSYLWSTGESTSGIKVTQNGEYSVMVFLNDKSCATKYIFNVEFKSSPSSFSLGEDVASCELPAVRLTPTLNDNYQLKWNDGSSNKYYDVSNFGTVWLEVENVCGSKTDSIKFTNKSMNISRIPNVITPNGDTHNEYFCIVSEGETQVSIFDRWGLQVYENKTYRNDWNGQGLSGGVYYCHIKDACGNQYKGPISIVR